MQDLFIFIFDLVRDIFAFTYDLYNSITIFGNASLWDFIIVIMIGGAIPVVIATAFGGVGLTSSIASTVSASTKLEQKKVNESYAHYREVRSRNERYKTLYDMESWWRV